MRTVVKFLLVPGLFAGTLIFYIYKVYRAEKQRKLAWLRNSSKIIETERGAIEYAIRGQGRPILYVHGGMGAYEQGLALLEILALEDFQIITFSRPGYRRTGIEIGSSLSEQAETMCMVLNHLEIETATVLAISAGGLSALQFAQDHPDRCDALILLSAQGPELARSRPSRFWLWLLDCMLKSDLFVWILMRAGMALLTRLMHVKDSPSAWRNTKQFFEGVFPASDWRIGTTNDVDQLIGQQSIDLESIRVPTLIMHGLQDNIVPPVVARVNAEEIAQAQLALIEGGSHMMMATHADEIRKRLYQFVTRVAEKRKP